MCKYWAISSRFAPNKNSVKPIIRVTILTQKQCEADNPGDDFDSKAFIGLLDPIIRMDF
jgi:hypothetical protein